MHAHEKALADWKRKAPKRHRPDERQCPHWDYEDESPECDCPCTARCNGPHCK
jgi:hypothetical protein